MSDTDNWIFLSQSHVFTTLNLGQSPAQCSSTRARRSVTGEMVTAGRKERMEKPHERTTWNWKFREWRWEWCTGRERFLFTFPLDLLLEAWNYWFIYLHSMMLMSFLRTSMHPLLRIIKLSIKKVSSQKFRGSINKTRIENQQV